MLGEMTLHTLAHLSILPANVCRKSRSRWNHKAPDRSLIHFKNVKIKCSVKYTNENCEYVIYIGLTLKRKRELR